MPTKAAFKAVSPGIQEVAKRMRVAGDGKPRILFLRDSLVEIDTTLEEVHKPVSTEQEIEGYVWDTRAGQRKGEQPLKLNDHGCDAARYAVAEVDELAPVETKTALISPASILSTWGHRR
jgi:phage terminase large subunit